MDNRIRGWLALAFGGVIALVMGGCSSLPDGMDGDLTNQWSRFCVCPVAEADWTVVIVLPKSPGGP